MDHDLLTEPLLSWRDADRNRSLATLPGVLSRLAGGELAAFAHVRPHQLDAWCMFLAQLAALAMHRSGQSDPRMSEAEWRRLLLDLTSNAREPWCLVVENLSKPAFFQPPVPEGTTVGWYRVEHPDDLDILVTSKNHDVKASQIASNAAAWVYALVSLQTTQGYPGRGYNRISRMKGGYGSRARVGLAADQRPSPRFLRDVSVLLEEWDTLVARGFRSTGLSLVWTRPWDGKTSLDMTQLSPHFIEICGRVRIAGMGDALACTYTTTQTRRCLPEIDNGDVGDAWIPIEGADGALTVGGGGFHYQLMVRLLFDGEFTLAAAQRLRDGDPDPMLLLASVMARGQGKTEGLHERTLPLSGNARRALGRPDLRAALGVRASENVSAAKVMRSKVLFRALKRLALGEKVAEDTFDSCVDEVFFGELFASLDQPESDARQAWSRRLYDIAWSELQRAIDRCCLPSAQWYRAVSEAEGLFHGCLNREFPDLAATLHAGTA